MLFETDRTGRITGLNEPDPEGAAPVVFLARSPTSRLIVFRADVPDALASELANVATGIPPWDGQATDDRVLDPLRRTVRARLGDVEESHGPAFRFPPSPGSMTGSGATHIGSGAIVIDEATAHLLEPNFPYTRSVLDRRSPVAAIVRDGVVVSACYAARRRATAAEAGVDTIEPYRGGGLAVAAVSAWAEAVRRASLTPLYSTSWENSASLRVAAKLGLEAYADTVSFG